MLRRDSHGLSVVRERVVNVADVKAIVEAERAFFQEVRKQYGIKEGDYLVCVGGPKGKKEDWFANEYGGRRVKVRSMEKSNHFVQMTETTGFWTGPNIFASYDWFYIIEGANGKVSYLDPRDLQYFKVEAN